MENLQHLSCKHAIKSTKEKENIQIRIYPSLRFAESV